MRSMLLPAALAAGLASPAVAQTAAPPAYPPAPSPPAYAAPPSPPPAYPPAGAEPQPMPPSAPTAPSSGGPVPGARPGNIIGTGMSEPRGTHASNIDRQDTRSDIAPNLPSPQLGPDASPADYLRAAQAALAAGRTGETQQALEQAETRLLDRSVSYGQTNDPSANPAIAQIRSALQALAAGDRAQSMQSIQAAIPDAQASAR